jgi:hypothetical protein
MFRTPAIALLACLSSLATALEAPAALPWAQSEALAWVVVPSFDRFFDQLQGTVSVFDPQQAASLRTELEQEVGVELVGAIAKDRPIVASLLPGLGSPEPRWLLILPVTDATPLIALCTATGTAHVASNGLLLLSSDPGLLTQPETLLAAYRALPAPADPQTVLQLELELARIMQTYGQMARGGLAMLPLFMGGAGPEQQSLQAMLPLLQALGEGWLLLLEDLDHASLALRLGPVPRLVKRITTKDGSSLNAAFQAPADRAAWRAAWQRLPAGQHMLRMAGCFNTAGLKGLYLHLLDGLKNQPAVAGLLDEATRGEIEKLLGSFTGVMVSTIHADPASFFQQDSITGLSEAILARFADSGLAAMYDEIGLPLDCRIERAYRQIEGTEVHRIHVFGEAAADNPAMQMNPMKASLKPMELAFQPGWYLASHDPLRLDQMLTGENQAPAEPRAVAIFGEGAACYIDYDYAFLLASTFATMMGGEAPTAPSELPIVMAVDLAEGALTSAVEIPLAPIRSALSVFMGPPPGAADAPLKPTPEF